VTVDPKDICVLQAVIIFASDEIPATGYISGALEIGKKPKPLHISTSIDPMKLVI